jgi:AcrR family transcriptional regulator
MTGYTGKADVRTNQRQSCRERLLRTASDLFYRHGCHTTGIDRILAESGVAKMTLYKHFQSKEELVLAVAERFQENAREALEAHLAGCDESPRDRLLGLFDVLAEWCARPGYYGCMSVNLAVQFPSPDHPIHLAVAEHKRCREGVIRSLAEEAGAANPAALAGELLTVMEGATVLCQVTGQTAYVDHARDAARAVIDRHLPRGGADLGPGVA